MLNWKWPAVAGLVTWLATPVAGLFASASGSTHATGVTLAAGMFLGALLASAAIMVPGAPRNITITIGHDEPEEGEHA